MFEHRPTGLQRELDERSTFYGCGDLCMSVGLTGEAVRPGSAMEVVSPEQVLSPARWGVGVSLIACSASWLADREARHEHTSIHPLRAQGEAEVPAESYVMGSAMPMETQR
jgi:hypothetical protein